MPIFQYECQHCGKRFEELVRTHEEEVHCPACGQIAVRAWSGKVYSSTGKPPQHCSGNCSTCSGCK